MRSRRLRPALLASVLVLGACTGRIEAGPPGPGDRPDDTTTPPVTGLPESFDDTTAATSFPRLSGAQWEAAVQYTLRLDGPTGLAFDVPARGDARFDTNVSLLVVTDSVAARYRDHASELAQRVTSDAASLARLLEDGSTPDERLRNSARGLLTRAYRRPPTEDELTRAVAMAQMAPEAGDEGARLREGLRVVIAAVLQSPHFVYRVERGRLAEATPSGTIRRAPLTDHELASRWSFALLGGPPDDVLRAAVERGELATPDGRARNLDRLLADPRTEATLLRFHRALYGVDQVRGVTKSTGLFPDYQGIGVDAEEEANRFLTHVISSDLGVRALLTSRTSFVNDRLARLYGLPTDGLDRMTYRRVELPNTRAGILTRVAWNAWKSDTVERNLILRGVFVIRNVLCDPLGPPASGNFGAAAMRTPPPELRSHREIIQFRTEAGDCASCHRDRINPIGAVFESYSAVGALLTTEDSGVPVVTRATVLMNGRRTEASDAVQFSQLLADNERVHRCYASNLIEYLAGEAPSGLEAALAAEVGRESRASDLSVRAIARRVLLSDAFRTLRIPGGGA